MARLRGDRRLIDRLAVVSPEERLRAAADAIECGFRLKLLKPLPPGWTLPILRGGVRWVGGDLRREDLCGDDGR